MKAMLLAAGRGERLKPLTDTLPKPLLKVGSQSLIERNIVRLKAAGVEEIVINVCYRAKQILDVIGDGSQYGVKVTFSFEPEQPLGTGGGVFQALRFLGDEPFILLSSDIWTDFPFEQLELKEEMLAHLVMVENPDFHPNGDFCLKESGLLDANAKPKLTYGNIAVIHPKLFKDCASERFSISPLFVNAMECQKVSGELYEGTWFNVGTETELARLQENCS